MKFKSDFFLYSQKIENYKIVEWKNFNTSEVEFLEQTFSQL